MDFNWRRVTCGIILCTLLLSSLGCAEATPASPTATAVADTVEQPPSLPPPAVVVAATATELPAPTATPVPLPTETLPPPTATMEPSPTAVAPTPTVPVPTETPPPSTATPAPLYPDWLGYLNRFRAMGGLPPLSERAALTLGSKLHSQYMVVNDAAISHKQDPGNPLYDSAGDQAARNGNIFATSMTDADHEWGINFWASAPFHLVPMLAPRLEHVGYGDYVEAGGSVSMAAVLDVRSERDLGLSEAAYPLLFPGDGTSTWIGRHNLFEWPDPLTSCPGFSRPTGPPIVIQLGTGELTPRVGTHVLLKDGEPVRTCLFDESTYYNPDVYAERAGRLILDNQDAVVIMPRDPLIAGSTYTVQIDVDGERYMWQFAAQASPDS